MTGEPIGDDVEVRACDGGPLLVRGATAVRDADGRQHPVTRPVVALCAPDAIPRSLAVQPSNHAAAVTP